MEGINLGKLKAFGPKKTLQLLGHFWAKAYRPTLFLFWIILLGWGSYVWYVSLHGGSQWFGKKGNETPSVGGGDVNLNKKALEKVLRAIETREQNSNQNVNLSKDIFQKY